MQHIHLPSGLTGFCNSKTTIEVAQSGQEVYLLHGELERDEAPSCPECGQKMHPREQDYHAPSPVRWLPP